MNKKWNKPLDHKKLAQIMDFTLCLGKEIMIRGGELWRVNDVLHQIYDAYGLKKVSIFMLPHNLVLSAQVDDQEPIMRMCDIGAFHLNMEEISSLRAMTNVILEEVPDPAELDSRLKKALDVRSYSPQVTVLGMVIALLSLNVIIGGTWRDAILIAVGISTVMGSEMYLGHVKGTNKMMLCFIGSFLIGVLDMVCFRLGFVADPYHIMIVTSIGLIPGIPLINALREMLLGRILGGSLLFMTAFMETAGAVCGFALSMALLGV